MTKSSRIAVVAIVAVLSAAVVGFCVFRVRHQRSVSHLGPVVTSATDFQLRQLGESIRQLLETGDVQAFVDATAVSMEDWNTVLPAGPVTDHPLGDDPPRSVRRYRHSVENTGQRLLALARRSGLVNSDVRFQVKEVIGHSSGTIEYDVAPGRHAGVRGLDSVVATLTAVSTSDAQKNGEYQIRIGGVRGFPSGWRLQGGVGWKAFPPGAADDATRRELTLTAKVAEDFRERRTLTLADDELLAKLGHALADLLRRKSVSEFVSAVTMGHEEMREFERKIDWGTAQETEENFRTITEKVATSGRALLDMLDELGVDLSAADITLVDATAERVQFGQWSYGSPEGIGSGPIRFTFFVRSPGKSKDGNAIASNYVIECGSAMRKDGRWILFDERTRWKELPSAITTKAVRERIAFENYVTEHRSLPLGSPAPDITLVRLDTGSAVRLSSYRGKVVVLEWWASWCGPCQEPMTKLQTLRTAHPEWKDRVEILTVSVDDELKTARDHAEKRQWRETTNTWTGAGGWTSAASKSFQVRGVPTLYIIDPQGAIVAAGHPASVPVADRVRKAMK